MTKEIINHLFEYNEHTGDLLWKNPIGRKMKPGDIAGTISSADGYRLVRVHGILQKAHRVIWVYVYGEVLEDYEFIDHINHVRSDNRLSNLRVVSVADNARNQSIRHDNNSGVTGVSYSKTREVWEAYITVDYVKHNLGIFSDISLAIQARKDAEILYGFHKNHGGTQAND